jgi:hypothetical protein
LIKSQRFESPLKSEQLQISREIAKVCASPCKECRRRNQSKFKTVENLKEPRVNLFQVPSSGGAMREDSKEIALQKKH